MTNTQKEKKDDDNIVPHTKSRSNSEKKIRIKVKSQ